MTYEIRIEGDLDQRWVAWFDGMRIAAEPGGVTRITGAVPDQSALHGVLSTIRDLGLGLVSVQRVDTSALP